MQSNERRARTSFRAVHLFERCRRFIFDKSRGPLRYALVAGAVAWLVGVAIAGLLDLALTSVEEPLPAEPLWQTAILAIMVAPLVENLAFILCIEAVASFSSRYRVRLGLMAAASLAFVTHSGSHVSHGLFAASIFATMAFTYMDWNELPWRDRYGLTVLQHVIVNAIPMALLVFERTMLAS